MGSNPIFRSNSPNDSMRETARAFCLSHGWVAESSCPPVCYSEFRTAQVVAGRRRAVHSPEVIAELKKNQEAYEAARSEIEQEHWGRTVLLHDGAVAGIYNDLNDAYAIGCEKYGLGCFSLQEVGAKPIELGFQALPIHHLLSLAD